MSESFWIAVAALSALAILLFQCSLPISLKMKPKETGILKAMEILIRRIKIRFIPSQRQEPIQLILPQATKTGLLLKVT